MGSRGTVGHLTDEDSNEADLFPLYSALAASALFIVIGILCPIDTALFLRLFFVGPILLVASIVVVICSIAGKHGRRYQRLLLALGILWVVSVFFFFVDSDHPLVIRSTARWMVWSHGYKKEVLAQPTPANGDLKHIEWDGWGFAGIDTYVFLVFDPIDSLAMAAINRQPGKFNGIPCEVPLVRRLESHWYTVQNYTDQYWDKCH
jgi:hypothetical protein